MSRVTGASHGSQPSRFRPFGFRLLASGYRLPMAGMPSPRMPDALMAVTRHQRMSLSSFICHRFSPRALESTFPQVLEPLSGPRSRPSGPWFGYPGSGSGAGTGGGWQSICHLPSVSPNRQPLTANRHHLLRLLAFPTPTPIPTPFPQSKCPPSSLLSKSVL